MRQRNKKRGFRRGAEKVREFLKAGRVKPKSKKKPGTKKPETPKETENKA